MVPLVGLQFIIVAFPGHTHLFCRDDKEDAKRVRAPPPPKHSRGRGKYHQYT